MIWQPGTAFHDAARIQRQRIQKMPIRVQRERSHWSATLAFAAWLGAYASGRLSFVVVALVMSVVAAVQFRQSRRPM